MKLPVGIYAVSAAFADKTGTVCFTFRDECYEAQIGENAFFDMDQLVKQALVPVQEPFMGYAGRPVVLVPAGVLPMGNSKIREERFRTFFPCAVVILGENAGIDPNGEDLRTPAKRRPESVIEGSFYFGCIAMQGETDGTLTVDGVCLQAKIYDQRTGGKDAALEVKNTIIETALIYTILRVMGDFQGQRRTLLQNCRAVGLKDYYGEGNLLQVESGALQVERLYMADTDKFFGMTDYAWSTANRLTSVTVRNCLFENCRSTNGLAINLSPDSNADILLEDCSFLHFTPEEDAAVNVALPNKSSLTVRRCHFAGREKAPAVLVDGELSRVRLEDVTQQGYKELCAAKPPRRTAADPTAVYPLEDPHAAVQGDFEALEQLYTGKQVYYGDFHCHSNSGGTSDGKTPIEQYAEDMRKLEMDFAAIVDHGQMRHFFLPCWDERYMICGTEPGLTLNEPKRPMDARKLHYTMIFPDKTGFQKVMDAFPGFAFTGTINGNYRSYSMPLEELRRLAEFVYSIGGLLTHAHPKQVMVSEDPMDYYISECVPLETVHGSADSFYTKQNRELWMTLLNMGKRIKTHGSTDSHGPVSNKGLTAVYAPKHFSTDIFNAIRSGNCVAGGVAIQMCIGDAPMGGVAAYQPGQQLLVKVEGFHPAHALKDTVFCLRVYTDKGLAYAREFACDQTQQLALPVQPRQYYRVEITNESDNCLVALSNPIWLDT